MMHFTHTPPGAAGAAAAALVVAVFRSRGDRA